MEKHVVHNEYLAMLEKALGTIKATLIETEESTHNQQKIASITNRAAESEKRDKKKYQDKTSQHLKDMADMFKTATDVEMTSQQIVKMANTAAADENDVSSKIAKATRSIEAAMQSVLQLSALAPAIKSRATPEGEVSKIAKWTEEASAAGVAAANAAEIASVTSLQATIFAAQSNARFITSYITDFATSSTTLNTTINTAMKTAQTNLTAATTDYLTALQTASDSESALAQAELNYESAKTANSEEHFKLGLHEAHKQV